MAHKAPIAFVSQPVMCPSLIYVVCRRDTSNVRVQYGMCNSHPISSVLLLEREMKQKERKSNTFKIEILS
jgi:hypothetical protein